MKEFFKKRKLIISLIAIVIFLLFLKLRYKEIVKYVKHDAAILREAAVISEHSRIVVFAPHCDDETLGCGGVVRKAALSGAKIKVVIITNGDGFRYAAEAEFRKFRLKPAQYIKFAEIRQRESLSALELLGLKENDIIFLGYPDRGLARLWSENWDYANLYTSKFTKTSYSPYTNSFRKNAPYCGLSLLSDIKEILIRFAPTEVFIPHPNDDHPDHWATNCFVNMAMEELVDQGYSFAKTVNTYLYLVHRGDWPLPQGAHTKLSLVPPKPLLHLDTTWKRFPLNKSTQDLKLKAIRHYKSQLPILKRFLFSFARTNELYGILYPQAIPKVPDKRIRIDGAMGDWENIKPVIRDPVADRFLEDMRGGADISSVYAIRDSSNLYLLTKTRKRTSSNVVYQISIHSFDSSVNRITLSIGRGRSVMYSGPNKNLKKNISFKFGGNGFEISVPLASLNFRRKIFLGVETKFLGATINRTAYRTLFFQ